jgi:hypothetical protein
MLARSNACGPSNYRATRHARGCVAGAPFARATSSHGATVWPAQPERSPALVAQRRPILRTAASQPRSTRPRAQAGHNLPRRNGDSEHTGRPVGGGSDPPPAAQPPGRGVTSVVNKTAGSGEPQPAPGATATWIIPVAQSEGVPTFRRRPNTGFQHAGAHRSSTRGTGTRIA